MNDAASFDAIMQCNLLEVFCEALGAAIFVTDKLDQVTFASIRLLHFFPLRQTAIEPGSRARDLYGALYDAGCRFGHGTGKATRDEWIAERIATAWKERVDAIEQTGPDRWVRIVSRRFSSGLGFIVMQDVSEQKKKENLLRCEQERVRLTEEILDCLPLPVAIKDRNLHFVAVNKEFCEIVQAAPEQVLGKSIWDVAVPDVARHMEEADWQLLSSGGSQESEVAFGRDDTRSAVLRQHSRRVGRPGNHFISMSVLDARSTAAADTEPVAGAPRRAMVPPPLVPAVADIVNPDPYQASARASSSKNVLYLVGSHYGGHALALGLGAHGIDLCLIRDEQEFAAFIPAAQEAGVTIDFVLIDSDFSPAAFNIAAKAGLDFSMLAPGSEDSTALAEILRNLNGRTQARPVHAPRPPETIQAPRVAAIGETAPAETRLDVLAVEDNVVNRMALEQILESLGFHFAVVASGKEAISAVMTRGPRLVLADLTLPDMGIDELAGALRRADGALPVIGLMPCDNEMNRHRCTAAGLVDCIAKPLSPEALDLVLREHLLADRKSMAAMKRPAA
jgi:PAS domain S-box-containing protein